MLQIEKAIEENFALRKSLQQTKTQSDKFERQLKQIQFLYEQAQKRITQMSNDYCNLQKKCQIMHVENTKNVNTLTSQIQELKDLIEEKQREMQNFQIKMIPSLDQDMIRVKLINEMEGPYQQTIIKKDNEISKLKDKLNALQRKYDLMELSLSTKSNQYKREIEDCKSFYQTENEKLMKQLSNLISKKEIKSYDKELIKSQRKEIDQLRMTLEFKSQTQIDLRRQISDERAEKQKLVQQISLLNEKNALQIHLHQDKGEIKSLKQEKSELQNELYRKKEEIQKLQKKIKALQKQNKLLEDSMRNENSNVKSNLENQRQLLREQLRDQKDEHRRLKDIKDRQEADYLEICQKYKRLERELEQQKRYSQRLKQTISSQQIVIKEYQISKKQKITLSKEFIREQNQRNIERNRITKEKQRYQTQIANSKDRDYRSAEKLKENEGTIINKKQIYDSAKDKQKIASLELKITKLKQKLEYANKKIVELIQEKAKIQKKSEGISSASRQRAFSNVQFESNNRIAQSKALLLEYRDTAFLPLVQPTIYTHFY